MDLFDRGRMPASIRQVFAGLRRRWWLVVALVAVVAVGTTLTNLPALTSPPYVESATFEIVAVSSGVSSYDGMVARSVAEMAGEDTGSWLIFSLSVNAAPGTVEVASSGGEVTITAHSATKVGAERLLTAAVAAIDAGVADGSAAPGSKHGDVLIRIVVTNAGSGAVVDEVAQEALRRAIALRALAALDVGLALLVGASLWAEQRRHVVAGAGDEERTPVGKNE